MLNLNLKQNVDTTITYLLFFMNKHVEFLNSVYNSLPFYDSNKEKYLIGVQFMIHRTKVKISFNTAPFIITLLLGL